MTFRPPPRSATWLLERFGCGSRLEPLIGDLAEQFDAGRSRSWYWRQAMGTLVVDFLRGLRACAPSFIVAVLVGCALTWLWQRGSSYALRPLYADLSAVSLHPWTAEALLRLAAMQMEAALGCALLFVTVWVVTRIHRAHPRAVLLAFVAALIAPRFPGVVRLVVDAAVSSESRVALAPVIMPTALQAVFTLAAGLWVIRAKRFTQLDRRTRVVTLLAVAQALVIALLYRAGLVGELPLPFARPEWYVLDILDVGSVGYLAVLLWRSSAHTRMTRHPNRGPTAGNGPPQRRRNERGPRVRGAGVARTVVSGSTTATMALLAAPA